MFGPESLFGWNNRSTLASQAVYTWPSIALPRSFDVLINAVRSAGEAYLASGRWSWLWLRLVLLAFVVGAHKIWMAAGYVVRIRA